MVRTIISFFGVFIGFALLFSFALVSDAEWTVLREDDILRGDGIEGMLQDVYFMDDQNGLVVGDGGLMLKTSDGGKTWAKVEIDMRPPVPDKDRAALQGVAALLRVSVAAGPHRSIIFTL